LSRIANQSLTKSSLATNFYKKVQDESESFQQFVTALKLLVKDCGYSQPEEMVRDRIVFGCRSTKLREKHIGEGSGLCLDKAVEMGLTMELSTSQLKSFKEEEDPKVQAIKQRRQNNRGRSKDKQQQATPSTSKQAICDKCGFELPHKTKDNECPAKGKQCKKVSKIQSFC